MEEDKFYSDLTDLLNRYSKENGSDTPDFILASYIQDCLLAYENAIQKRDKWYDFKPFDDGITTQVEP